MKEYKNRFVKEYAAYSIRDLEKTMLPENKKTEKARIIKSVSKDFYRGLITPEEAIKSILLTVHEN